MVASKVCIGLGVPCFGLDAVIQLLELLDVFGQALLFVGQTLYVYLRMGASATWQEPPSHWRSNIMRSTNPSSQALLFCFRMKNLNWFIPVKLNKFQSIGYKAVNLCLGYIAAKGDVAMGGMTSNTCHMLAKESP